jgi:hypothetical protein
MLAGVRGPKYITSVSSTRYTRPFFAAGVSDTPGSVANFSALPMRSKPTSVAMMTSGAARAISSGVSRSIPPTESTAFVPPAHVMIRSAADPRLSAR